MLQSYGLSDTGRARKANEDSFVVRQDIGFFAVCDGLGGQNAGEVASRLVAEITTQFIEKSHADKEVTWPFGLTIDLSFDANRLFTAISLANKRVFKSAESKPEYSGMASTIVSAIVRDDTLTLVWAGDSRAYLIRNGAIEQISKDHSWINMALQSGIVTPEEAAKHPWGHVLTQAVGGRDTLMPTAVERKLENGDLVLLCSDGLTTMVKDDGILNLLTPVPILQEGARKLVAAANEAGGKDNITVVLLRYEA